MTSPNTSQKTSRIRAGEFPQPTSPWESRTLLYAEIAGVAVFLAAMLFSTSDVDGLWRDSSEAKAMSTTTFAVADQLAPATSSGDAAENFTAPTRN